MKTSLLFLVVLTSTALVSAAPIGRYQHGTVVRMHMGDCMLMHGGFMTAFGPPQPQANEGVCPEYTLLSEKVVFVIVGKNSNELVPLAENIDFRFHNKDLMVRVDDARHESKFAIKEMTLRSQWEKIQKHVDDELNRSSQDRMDTAIALRSQE